MELKLQLCIFILLVHVSHAVLQHVTVFKGQTLTLNCPITNAVKNQADWKNPAGFLMFFNRKRVLRDKRYSINKLTKSEFSISVSDVTFKDGGNYTCSEYSEPITERKVEVTVLSRPRMITTKHNGETVIKCTAEGNHHAPQISWQIDEGPEFLGHTQVYPEDNKYVSEDQFHIKPSENKVSLKCLVRHPALQQPLMDFVKIGRNSTKSRRTKTTISSPTAQPQGSTHGRTTVYPSTTGGNGPSTGSSAKLSTVSPSETKTFTSTVNHVPSTSSHHSTSRTSVLSESTTEANDTISNETSTTGWTSVSETTVEIVPYNSTGGNQTDPEGSNDLMKQGRGGSSLLVFLVTCLILCLLVVVIFFAIKLRRAHILWKRENEESVPSEESNKSKSSQEEKNAQAQRRKGLFNTAFTQYVVEEPTAVTSVINPGVMAATAVVNNEHTSQAQSLSQTAAKSNIKETEL